MNTENELEEEPQLIKCKNYFICNQTLSKWWYSVKKTNLCNDCHFKYNKELQLKLNTYCPSCLYHKKCIQHLECPHYICMDCFKDFYTGQPQENKCYSCRSIK